MPSVLPTLWNVLSVPLAKSLSPMLLCVLLCQLDLSVLPALSVCPRCQLFLNALQDLLGLKGQPVILVPLLSLRLWKSVCAQREHPGLLVLPTLSNVLSVPLATSLSPMLLCVLQCQLDLSVLPDLSVSQRYLSFLNALLALYASHTHQHELCVLLVLCVKLSNFAHRGNQCALKSLKERTISPRNPHLLVLCALNSHQYVLEGLSTQLSNTLSTNLAALILVPSRLLVLLILAAPKLMSPSPALRHLCVSPSLHTAQVSPM